MDWNRLDISDLRMISELPLCHSLRSWAQLHGMTVAKASRKLKFIEDALGVCLAHRSTSGLSPTSEGEVLAETVVRILKEVDAANDVLTEENQPFSKKIVVGTRGFLAHILASCFAESAQRRGEGLQILDLSPKEGVAMAKKGFLDFLVSFEAFDLGTLWKQDMVGKMEWRVYGRAGHPLSRGATMKQLAAFRVGHHVFWDGAKLIANEGMLHSHFRIRQLGYGCQSAQTAVALATSSDQAVCVPKHVAQDSVDLGRLVEIPLHGKESIKAPVYLHTRSDQVPQTLFRSLYMALKQKIEAV